MPSSVSIRILLFLLFAWAAAHARENRLSFEYLTNNNGLTHNTVYDICQDGKGFLWFATEAGLNRYDGEHIKSYHHVATDPRTLPARAVPSLVYTTDSLLFVGTTDGLAVYRPETDDFLQLTHEQKSLGHFIRMEQGRGSELLICTENNGFFVYNYRRHTIVPFRVNDHILGATTDIAGGYWAFSRYALYRFNDRKELMATYPVSPTLFASSISYIGKNGRGELLVGTFGNGVFVFHPADNAFRQLPVCRQAKMYYVRTIEQGETPDEFWIGTESGLYIVRTDDTHYHRYTHSFDNKRRTINDNAVYKIYRSRQGIFYAGTYFGGVNIVHTHHIGFQAFTPDNRPGALHGKAVSMMREAPDNTLWVATEDAGIAIFDPINDTFQHLLFDEKDPASISSDNVHALLMDGQWCWAGHFMGGISKINIATRKAVRFLHHPGNPRTLSNNFVFALQFLSPDSILVGTLSGIDLFDKRSATFSRFRENELAGAFVYDIFHAPDGKIWFCTYNRGIFILDKNQKGLMTHYTAGDHSGLTSNSIISYCIDSKKQIYIGTRDGGLLKYHPNKAIFEQIPATMLIDNIVYGIVEDRNRFFWVSTNKGISRLDFATATATHFNVKHGIAGNQHNYKSYLQHNGMIYFGSVSGLTRFDPGTLFTPNETPAVYLSNLRIFNEIMRPDAKKSVLTKQIDHTNQLRLRHYQNSFTIDYASINYFAHDIVYEYYLEGFETSWAPPTERQQANYTNIPPGKYTFHIRATNLINNAVSSVRTLQITIAPAWWNAWYAYLCYALLLCGIVFYFYRTYKNRQQEQMALAVEKIEKQNLKLLHQHKINFFTYISHEFKTPLSIIISSVDMMMQKNTDSTEDEIRQTIRRSAGRLLALVNQLLEFRKIETDHAEVHITKGNVIDFAHQIINGYRPLLDKKNIRLSINVSSYTQAEIDFDFDKLEKIMTNLLTNAIKYTPPHGNINFTLSVEDTNIRFSVKDSGKGIPEKEREKIFEVFYSERFSDDVVESSGIGLALTASLVKLLKGEITVTGQQGKGSQFSVRLPHHTPAATRALPTTGATPQAEDTLEPDVAIPNTPHRAAETEQPDTPDKALIVMVEDNKDLLDLLHRKFRERYHIKCFNNGKEALEYIRQKAPDVIVTDIMMPKISGIELCRLVKTDINLCHVPVIMLTAKDSPEAKLEGLQVGADAYIAKPFSMTELEVRLDNILTNQRALKRRLNELSRFEKFDIPDTNHEQAFVEKILAVVQANIANSRLDVQFIAETLHISRSGLHKKVKQLTNISVTEFINSVRINKAKELIAQGAMTFSEIADAIGYNDSAYFTRIFKKHTGQTPKAYRQKMRSE